MFWLVGRTCSWCAPVCADTYEQSLPFFEASRTTSYSSTLHSLVCRWSMLPRGCQWGQLCTSGRIASPTPMWCQW